MRNTVRSNALLIVVAFATVYLVWGSTYWAIKLALESFPPFMLGAVRYLIAGGLMLLVARLTGAGRPTRDHWRAALITGTLLLVMGNGAVIFAEQRAPTGLVALIVASAPLWIVLLDWLRPGGVRPTGMVFAGLVAGTAGVALLVDPTGGAGSGVPLRETIMLVIGAMAWSAGSLWSKHARIPGSAILLVALQMVVGGVLFSLASLLAGEPGSVRPGNLSGNSLLGIGYLILFGSIVAFTAYVWLVRTVSPAAVSTYAYVNPVVAVAIGTFIGGEQLTPRTMLAAAVLLGAVVLITAGPVLRRARRPDEVMAVADT